MAQAARHPEAIAHRGIRDKYPENSLPAFLAALDAGAQAIELDVHATRDGVIVVHHDPSVVPNRDEPLSTRRILDLTYDDLTQIDLGSGVRIPTLVEALAAITPRARAYVEIKAPGIEGLVGEIITRVPEIAGKCAVHSFDHRIALNFSEMFPDVDVGILMVGYPVDAPALLRSANARDFWASCEFIDAKLVNSVHRGGGRVIAWTCNAEAEWDRLAACKVDGICSDRVQALVARAQFHE